MRSQIIGAVVWTSLALALACAGGVIFLISSSAADKALSIWGALALGLLGVLAAITALVPLLSANSIVMSQAARWAAKAAVALLLMTFAGLGALSDTLGLLEPRPAIESKPGVIESTLNDIAEALPARSPPAKLNDIQDRISGRWGEFGCEVVYLIRAQDNHVIVEGVRQPPGTAPYRLSATIIGWRENALEVRAETPSEARGKAATFEYWTNGADQKLAWKDPAGSGQLDLVPCS